MRCIKSKATGDRAQQWEALRLGQIKGLKECKADGEGGSRQPGTKRGANPRVREIGRDKEQTTETGRGVKVGSRERGDCHREKSWASSDSLRLWLPGALGLFPWPGQRLAGRGLPWGQCYLLPGPSLSTSWPRSA